MTTLARTTASGIGVPFDSKWLLFELVPPSRKTCVWEVIAKVGNVYLGVIEWYGPWRQYIFIPAAGTLFNRGCLRDIAQFCEDHHSTRSSLNNIAEEHDKENND